MKTRVKPDAVQLVDVGLWLAAYLAFLEMVFPVLAESIGRTGADFIPPVVIAHRIAFHLSSHPLLLLMVVAIGIAHHLVFVWPRGIRMAVKMATGLLLVYLMCFLSLPVLQALSSGR